MDINNKCMKFDLPLDSRYKPAAVIHVVDVGNVQLPVSLKNAEKLLQKANPTLAGCGLHRIQDDSRNSSWQIERTCISFLDSSKFLERNISRWIKLVLSQHKIDVQYAEVNCSLTRMNLYRSGSHYIRHRHVREEIGHFGTIILQIPVEDGFEGGELEINSQSNRKKPLETSMLDLSSDSDRSFYANFLNVNCVREMRPLTRGWRIELAYNILWKPEIATLVLPNISSFLVTLTKMAVELRSWQEHISEETPPKIMIIGLDHDYDPDCHSFSTLLDQDRQMALLLNSIPFVNVHLARLTRKITGPSCSLKLEYDDDVMECDPIPSKTSISSGSATGRKEALITTHSASHWIGVDNCVAPFQNLDIDAHAQFVEPLFETNTIPDKVENQESEDGITSHHFYQSVLVLWHKQGSFYMDLHHRPEYLLDQVECGAVPNTLAIVRAMISHSNCTELIICRLLNICLSLNVKMEALQLLNLMVDKSIGIPSDDAAALISDVECKLIGWTDCEEVIDKLLKCKPYQQLGHFATLAKQLLYRNCISGFLSVSNQTWNFLIEKFRTTGTFDNYNTLIACIQISFCTEEYSVTLKSEQFLSCFVQLPLVKQCRLIIDLKDIYQQNSTGRNFYLSLCRYVAVTFTTSYLLPSCDRLLILDWVVDLLRCFLLLDSNHGNIADIFVENVCRQNSDENNHLLEKLLASMHNLNLTSQMVIQLLDSRITELNPLSEPKFTWSMKGAKFPDADKYPQIVEFLKSIKKDIVIKFDSFNDIQQAKDFIVFYFGVMEECVERGYSAMAEPKKKGRKISCAIVKTRHLHMALVKQFYAKMEELKRLKQLRAFYEISNPSYVESSFAGSTLQTSSAGASSEKTKTDMTKKSISPLCIESTAPKKKKKK